MLLSAALAAVGWSEVAALAITAAAPIVAGVLTQRANDRRAEREREVADAEQRRKSDLLTASTLEALEDALICCKDDPRPADHLARELQAALADWEPADRLIDPRRAKAYQMMKAGIRMKQDSSSQHLVFDHVSAICDLLRSVDR